MTDHLKALSEKLGNLDGTHHITWAELYSENFMRAHSQLGSISELIKIGGFQVESAEDFKAIPDEEWETCVKANTDFSSWGEMQRAAMQAWTTKKLGMG